MWSVRTEEFIGDAEGHVEKARMVKVDEKLQPIPGTDFELKADLVLLAMGFVHPVHEGMIEEVKPELDERGNVRASEEDYRTSVDKLFAAGDMRRGQSLVVWAIREGRQAARAIDEYLRDRRGWADGCRHLPRRCADGFSRCAASRLAARPEPFPAVEVWGGFLCRHHLRFPSLPFPSAPASSPPAQRGRRRLPPVPPSVPERERSAQVAFVPFPAFVPRGPRPAR